MNPSNPDSYQREMRAWSEVPSKQSALWEDSLGEVLAKNPDALAAFWRDRAKAATASFSGDVLRFMAAMEQLPNSLHEFARMPEADKKLAQQLMFGAGTGSKRGEILEMAEAWEDFCKSGSLEHLTEFVDGAIDSIYVILWTLLKLGVPVEACWNEVQRSNIAKLGPDGKVQKSPEGKVIKPASWKAPDLFSILQSAATEVHYVGGIARHDKSK